MLNELEQNENGIAAASPRWPGSDDLKESVRKRLITLSLQEHEAFVQSLESEMRQVGLTMRSHLLLLGIPAKSPGEMTPNEVGHLVRFWSINKPEVIPVVGRVMSRFNACLDSDESKQIAEGLVA